MVLTFNKIKYIISLLFIILYSCDIETEINNIYSFDKKLLSVHGFVSNVNGVELQIFGTTSPDNILATNHIKNASVKLFENNNFIFELEEMDSGIYVSPDDFLPLFNQSYHIEINVNGFEPVTSTPQLLLVPVPIDTIYYEVVKNPSLSQNQLINLFFKYNDPNESNYYYKKIIQYPLQDQKVHFEEYFNPYSTFNDSLYNGMINTIYEENVYILDYDSIKVELYTLSNKLYRFLNSITEYEYTYDNPFANQPSPVFSNIIGGSGIFGSYSVSEIILKLNN